MARTATLHLHVPHVHLHRQSTASSRTEMSALGLPQRILAASLAVVGIAFIGVALAANLFHVGPAFDRMTDGFRPMMTSQSIQTERQDVTALAAAGTEIQTKMIPTLAAQLGMSPTQLTSVLAAQYPAVTAGLTALPTVTPKFTNLINTMDAQRPYFAAADAIPTKDLPTTSVPWALAGAGVVLFALGGLTLFKPRMAAGLVAGLGVLLVAAPLVLSLPHKASYADKLNTSLKPVYTQTLISDGQASLATLSAMGTEMQQKMLPGLAAQLKMQPAQLQQLIDKNFPATSVALKGMTGSLTRFQNLIATYDKHLRDYNVIRPQKFVPIVQFSIGSGVVLLLIGAAGLFVTRSNRTA